MENHQLVNQDSGNVEWFTPRKIVQVASKLMHGIDLDPACSDAAWKYQNHHAIYYHAENGLSREWNGKVWMNHPFARSENRCTYGCRKKICKKRGHHIDEPIPGNEVWINKLVNAHDAGRVEQACCITYASVSEQWFQPLLRYPQFFFCGRVNYIDGTTLQPVKSVTKGSVFTWLFDKKMRTYQEAAYHLQMTFAVANFEGVAK